MVRFVASVSLSALLLTAPASAESPESDPRVARALSVQKAITEAREHLQAGRAANAVSVLEAEILYVNGNSTYLELMKTAYLAHLKELAGTNAESDRAEHARRQLRILDPNIDVEKLTAVAPKTGPVARASADDGADPFQQEPADRQAGPDVKARAASAFAAKRYAEAAKLFAQADRSKLALSAEERQAWSYSRLHEVAARLNRGDAAGPALADLEKEAEDAVHLGGPSLEKFGQQVLATIRKRKSTPARGPTAVPEGWQAHEGESFRVFYRQSKKHATEAAAAAEQLRAATFEKWSGPAGAVWSPRCDLWLHETAAEYARETQKPAASPGHSSVGVKDGRVVVRRIDLRCDEPELLTAALAREVAYVVISDLFADQPLPRWADVGMTTLSAPPAEAGRYVRALPRLTREKQFLGVRQLLKTAEFPEADRITAFYVESVSLVDYLVRLKGPKAFANYLREAPRRGYEEALQRHYGFKDANELQEKWLKSVAAAE